MPLTSAIYDEDGTINWTDNNIRDSIFAHGDATNTLENYGFLYDVYKLRTAVNSTSFLAEQKDIIARSITKQLFPKHIERTSKDSVRYTLYFLGNKSNVDTAINISDVLYQKFVSLNLNIEQKSAAEIMSVFEDAVSEITPSLGLPARNAKRFMRQREYSGVVHAVEATKNSNTKKKGSFLMFTPSSSPIISEEGITWARSTDDNSSAGSNSQLIVTNKKITKNY